MGAGGAGKGPAGSAVSGHRASPPCPGGAARRRDRLPGGTTSCGLGLRALRPAAGAPQMSPESLGRRKAGGEPGAGRHRREGDSAGPRCRAWVAALGKLR